MSEQITPNPSVPTQVVQEVKFPQFVNNLGIIPTSYKDSMSYYETLAWLCKYLEETVIPTLNQNGNAVEELQGLYIELNSYVAHYFDTLDVQQEINHKLDVMSLDGSLSRLLSPLVDEKYQTLQDLIEINENGINENSNSIATLNTRITNIASLTEGSTTGDAELIDIRTTEGGITENSAGNSVRNQIKDIGKGYILQKYDYTLEQGNISQNEELESTVRLRSDDYIDTQNADYLYYDIASNYSFIILMYDSLQNYISGSQSPAQTGKNRYDISRASYIRIVMRRSDNSTIEISEGTNLKYIAFHKITDSQELSIENLNKMNSILNEAELNLKWEAGGFDTNTGEKGTSSNRIRTVNDIVGETGKILHVINNDASANLWVFRYLKSDSTYVDNQRYNLPEYDDYYIELNSSYIYKFNIYRSAGNPTETTFEFYQTINIFETNELLKNYVENYKYKLHKPFIALTFDYSEYSADNSGNSGNSQLYRQDILKDYGFKASLSLSYNNIKDGLSNPLQKTINDYDWDYTAYGTNGSSSDYDSNIYPYINNEAYYSTIYNNIKAYYDKFEEVGIPYPIAYCCRNNENGTTLNEALKNIGFKISRANSIGETSIPKIYGYSFIPDERTFGTYELYHGTYNLLDIKAKIDDCINQKGILTITMHRIYDDLSNSSNASVDISLAEITPVLQYLKDKVDDNLLIVGNMRDLYNLTKNESECVSKLEYNRILNKLNNLS